MATEILLAASWLLSLAFIFSLGVTQGFKQAHDQRVQLIEAVKGTIFQIIERFKPNEKEANLDGSVIGAVDSNADLGSKKRRRKKRKSQSSTSDRA